MCQNKISSFIKDPPTSKVIVTSQKNPPNGDTLFGYFGTMDSVALKYLGFFFLAVAAQGLFFAIVQLSSTKRNAPRVFLSFTVLCFSLALTESGLWWSEQMQRVVHLMEISAPLPLLFGPLTYFYFRSSLTPIRFQRRDVLHFLPFAIYFLYCAQFYFNSTASKNAVMDGSLSFSAFFVLQIPHTLSFLIKSASLVAYSVAIWYKFYNKTQILSEVKNWFLLAFGVYVFYVINYLTFHALEKLGFVGGCSDYGIAGAMSIFIYLFAWFGFVRPQVFDGYSIVESLRPGTPVKYKSSVLTEAYEAELAARLEGLMRTEKLYKNEQLRLETLAERLGVSRNSVSQVINRSGMNFFEYINYWRIEEAKTLLSETSKRNLNVIEVAYAVGFSNKVSFNRFFKKSTGLTPTEFRKLYANKKTAHS